VYDNACEVIAAVSISVPSVRLTEQDIPRYGEIVMAAARDISGRLGHSKSRDGESVKARGKPRSKAAGSP
jgi:hypothetical protein